MKIYGVTVNKGDIVDIDVLGGWLNPGVNRVKITGTYPSKYEIEVDNGITKVRQPIAGIRAIAMIKKKGSSSR